MPHRRRRISDPLAPAALGAGLALGLFGLAAASPTHHGAPKAPAPGPAASAAAAQASAPTPPPEPTSAAAARGFAVVQIATNDPKRLIADWFKPKPGQQLATSTDMIASKPIVTFLIFKGCAPAADGNCNVTADYEVTDPNGNAYDQTEEAAIWVGRPPPTGDGLQLAASSYGFRLKPKDPLGVYRVRVTIVDHVSGLMLQTQQSLTVAAK
ncbi:MAG: hypothetical protein JO127_15070 [Caulobacteraceae bacterium]|nr:hypothetical protein [Caulobacteraceae bacterium]